MMKSTIGGHGWVPPYRFKNDDHWNKAGNRWAAMCLYRVLEEEIRLPALTEETLRATLRQYYAAFGGMDGDGSPVSSPHAVGMRERYQALDILASQ